MDGFFHELLASIFQGGSTGVLSILILAVLGLCFIILKREAAHTEDRKEALESFQKQIDVDREALFKILEKYQEGQLNVVQAMNEIKVLIATIGGKL